MAHQHKGAHPMRSSCAGYATLVTLIICKINNTWTFVNMYYVLLTFIKLVIKGGHFGDSISLE